MIHDGVNTELRRALPLCHPFAILCLPSAIRRYCHLLLMLTAMMTLSIQSDLCADDWKPLWSAGAPEAKGSSEHDVPALLAFPADKSKSVGCGVVVCPGGGYGGLAMDHEGFQIAKWFNDRGVSAWILRYRLGSKGYHHPVQKGDVLRAIRTVRSVSADFGVDPNRIGVMGFSAGGHLASTAATHFDAGDAQAADPIDRVSSRPDFAILCYPVITMESPFTHMGSRRNLFGPDRVDSQDLIQLLSNEKQVKSDTPPTFIFHTTEDQAVPVENALLFYSALRAKQIARSEMHIYQNGRHGVGLAQDDPILKSWSERLENWLAVNQFLTQATAPAK
ncbi:MAG: alpha/beta hydrolase [Planctomyces sp.]|jgi:acetyl esterase/lipase